MQGIEAIVRAFAALEPEQIRRHFGPCQGSIELIELTTRARVMIEDLDQFAASQRNKGG